MKNYFVNPDTGLLRAGWRILAFFAFFMAITAVSMYGIREILGSLKRGSNLQFGIMATCATIAAFLARKYIDKKPIKSFGLKFDRYAIFDIFSGVLNSALVMLGMFILLRALGLIEFNGFTWWTDSLENNGFQMIVLPVVGAVFLQLVYVAWWEELVFRGYIFQNMKDGMGVKWAIIIASLVFGFGHAMNPNATLLSSIFIVLMTPQLIYAYWKTGQLWLPIGLHLGWNFFQASIFGFAASGQSSPSLISQTAIGPNWLSGGAFGAEGSIFVIPFTIASFYLIHWSVQMSRKPRQKFFEGLLYNKI